MRSRVRLAAIAAVWLCLFAADAAARWKPEYAAADPKRAAWYSKQRNAKGNWCCDDSDAHDFYGDVRFDENGDVEFDDDAGQHHRLAAYMVLHGPNPIGHAVWWYAEPFEYGHIDYCFAPGAGG